jgi:hypothetical protein
MKGLIKTNTKQGNYGTNQSYRGQSAWRPKRVSTKSRSTVK